MNNKSYLSPQSLTRPHLWDYIRGLFVAKTYDKIVNNTYGIPLRVGDYWLDQQIIKTNKYQEYSVGLYKKGEDCYFVKTWQGRVKNYSYYALINECIVGDVLSRRIAESMPGSFLRIPRVIEVYQEKNVFSVVFEYVVGRSLETFENEVKQNTLLDIADDLGRLSVKLLPSDIKRIPKHAFLYYCLLLPVYAFVLMLKYPQRIVSIGVYIILAFKNLRPVFFRDVQLAHRDIGAENVIVTDSNVYLLDCETVILTYPYFDFAMLESDYALRIPSHISMLPETLFNRIIVSIQRLILEHDSKSLQVLDKMRGHHA